MTDENNVFSQFGARSSKFDELLKKYQTIDEGDTVDTASVAQSKQDTPVQEEPAAVEEPSAPVTEEVAAAEMPEAVAEEPAVEISEEPATVAVEEPSEPEFELPDEVAGFTFDEAAADQPEEPEEEPEPDFSYDLDMFGKSSTTKTLDIDSFDDSWLDTAIDESVFYSASSYVPAAPEEPEAAQPNPEPEAVEEPEAPQIVTEPEHFVEQTPDTSDTDSMAGGYIAPSDFTDFEFDPESGLGFDFDEDIPTPTAPADEAPVAPKPEKKKAAKEKPVKEKPLKEKKSAKEKKESGKNEASYVTGFSKKYNASEGKGSKKDGFFTRNFVPKKDDSTAEKIRKIVMILCVLAFIGSALYLFNDYVIEPWKNSKQIDELEGLISDSNEVADKLTLEQQYPGIEFPEGMLEKYAALYARNQDFVGWITIDGLDISLPIVRGENNEKYLKTNFDGKSNKYGSIFMNCSNRVDRLNYNTTLFGHYMYDSKMFGNLVHYKSANGYKKAPLIEFNTLFGNYKWKVFAVFITGGTSAADNGYLFNYIFTDLTSEEAVENFLGEIKQRSLYYPKVDIALSDKILTLSTCTYEFDEARLVIMARMVRPGESEAVDTSSVRYNPNPRYPAAYYKENSLSNPYASAYRWYPS